MSKKKPLSTHHTGNLESPFLDQELFVDRGDPKSEQRAAALAAASPFQSAFEEGWGSVDLSPLPDPKAEYDELPVADWSRGASEEEEYFTAAPYGEDELELLEQESEKGLRGALKNVALLPHSVTLGSVEAPLKPVNIIPGIYDGPIRYKIASGLQTCLNTVMKDARFREISVALVDLTGGISQPEFAGFNHKQQIPAREPSKLAAMLAAFQLRHDLRILMKTQPDVAKGLDTVFAEARSRWKAAQTAAGPSEGFAGPITKRGNVVFVSGKPIPLSDPKSPQLETIFRPIQPGEDVAVEFTDTGEEENPLRDLVEAAFTGPATDRAQAVQKLHDLGFRQRLALTMGPSRVASDLVAPTVIRDIGYAYITSVLLQYGLYDPNRGGGLWLGSDYDRSEWQGAPASSLTKVRGGARSATAGSLATFLTLLMQDRLVDPQSSAEMRDLLKQDFLRDRSVFGFKEGIEKLPDNASSESPTVLTKGGTRDGGTDDCGFIERLTTGDQRLRYVAVALGAKSGGLLRDLIQALDQCVSANHSAAATPETSEGAEFEQTPFGHASSDQEGESEDQIGTFGAEIRNQITATDRIPFRWICSITATKRIIRPSHDEHTGLAPAGTGVLVSPCHVLTAAHVLKGVDDNDPAIMTEAETVKVMPGRDEDREPFGTYDVKSWVLHPKWDPKVSDPKTDIAVITLDTCPGNRKFPSLKDQPLGFWPQESLPAAVAEKLIGGTVLTAGYPESKKKQMWCFTGQATTGSAAGDKAIIQSGRVAEWIRRNSVVHLTADAKKGQSGSPVWVTVEDKPYLVGVLVEAGTQSNVARLLNNDMVSQIQKWMGQPAPTGETADGLELETEIEAPYIGRAEHYGLEEYEDSPPAGLILLDHMHIPKTPDATAPGGFKAGAITIMKPSAMNPGFVNASDELITDTSESGLQTCLEKAIRDKFSKLLARKTDAKPAAGDRVKIAIVDLTGAKLAKPDFAGWGSTVGIYAASSAKILAVYAAFQLRRDLRKMAEDQAIPTGEELADFAVKTWKDKTLKRGFPNLDWLFDIKHWSAHPNDLNFTPDVKDAFAHIDHNDHASLLIRRVGFPYIASVAWQSGLRHSARGGLWLSRAYDGGDEWADNPSMKAALFHNITALSGATFFTLLAQGRLVDDSTSAEIRTVLASACHTCLFPAEINLEATKCGFIKPYMHDAFLAKHSGVRYAAAILTELDATWRGILCPTGGETGLYTDLCRAMDALIVNNNKHPKSTC